MEASQLFSVKGLVALITGGGSGFGLTMAKALEANGAEKVFIVGRDLAKLEKAAAQGAHGNIVPIQGNVTSKDDLLRIAATVKETVGYINLVIVNAGLGTQGSGLQRITPQSSIEELQACLLACKWEDYTAQFDIQFTATLHTAVVFLSLLDAGNKKGNVGWTSQFIATGSAQGFNKAPLNGFGYNTSKAAQTHLIKSLANYLIPWNIRSNMISPGFYPTDMTKTAIERLVDSEGKVPAFISPMRRTGELNEIASLILMLASAGGAYSNGSIFLSDGGRMANSPSLV
ncbi:Short-chain dehydrogenase/reductase SAT3 [Lachnellula suecica]|uniref:Short-chain dehydrogenase/reductase SAT3 n=1 Tax=Lachnellula suecica TaxID=602035 RepID=A0A8T9CFB7_9HELO|nr:Short-chain dehydrogenase/reductase SAT3 [Lachnellula suecica]